MAAHSGSGFDLTPPSPEQRKLLRSGSDGRRSQCAAPSRHGGAVLWRIPGREASGGLHLPALRPATVPGRARSSKAAPAGRASRRPSTTITCVKSVTQVTAWRVRSFSAPAAAATRGTCSPTARRPRACATASTPCLWTLRPRASRCPTSSAVVPRRASPGKGDRLRGGLRSTPCMPRRATHLESLEARASPASER